MRIYPYFRWYDLWMGIFIDVPKGRVYLGLPMFGLVFELTAQDEAGGNGQ